MNALVRCKTQGCSGRFVPVKYQSKEGAICMTFNCNASLMSLNSSRKYNETQTRIGLASQIAFIASGGTYATYKRALKFGLGMKIASSVTFLDMLALLHPVLKSMVDEVCQEGRDHKKSIDPSVLGSWEAMVAAWMTRDYHSKKFFNQGLFHWCASVLLPSLSTWKQ